MNQINQNELNEMELCRYDDEILTEEEYYEMLNKEDKNKFGYLYGLPDIKERILILDTEVSGNKKEGFNLIELCAFEMINGKLTGNKFHSFFKPKNKTITIDFIKKHKIPEYVLSYTGNDDINKFLEFLNFVKDSKIITHNAIHDMEMINKSLKYYNLSLISKFQFKCSMRTLLDKNSDCFYKFNTLEKCLDHLKIKYEKKNFHLAKYDAYYLSKIIEFMYEKNNKNIKEEKNDNNNKKIISNEKEKNDFTESEIEEIVEYIRKEQEEQIIENILIENEEKNNNNNFIGKKRK
jgi:DNA polymerase-3 subunit epsilon